MIDRATIAAMRFGYGLPLPEGAPVDPAAMIERLAGPDLAARDWPGLTLDALMPGLREAEAARVVARRDAAGRPAYRAALRARVREQLGQRRTTLARALGSPDGFRERLVAFWADHFTTTARVGRQRTLPLALVEDAIRPQVAGRFAAMLEAVTLHPAMLLYLDQSRSVGPNSPAGLRRGRGLNENLGRELLELHTLGVDADYGQEDVRQMAELLTGLRFDTDEGTVFFPAAAEPGPETVLGRAYAGDDLGAIRRALADLAVHPATARHLTRKLAVHFVGDAPDPGLAAAMERAWTDTGGDLRAVCAAMLGHPAAWDGPLTKARQPWDLVVAGLRALGVGPDRVLRFSGGAFNRLVGKPLAEMGQPLQEAPGPDGWPEADAAWITPERLAARITWAMTAPDRLLEALPDPVALAEAGLGPLAGEALRVAVSRAEDRRVGVGLLLASPAFNRR